MFRNILLSMTVLMASSVVAQTPEGAAGAPAPAPAPDQAQGTGAAAPAAAPPAGANSSSQIATVVDSGFATYDKDGSGTLSPAEFKQWIADLKAQEMTAAGKPANPAEAKQYAASAWKAADKNKDGKVSKAELTAFLSG